MMFKLYYPDGPLKSNADPSEKQRLRRAFHPQLKKLWEQEPLSSHLRNYLNAEAISTIKDFSFLPLISSKMFQIADIEILMLRRQSPGLIVGHGGDIDNRIKTLFDSFSVPKIDQIADGDSPSDDEPPYFYCLLEDDALITNVTVRTDRLLTSGCNQDVVLVINVIIKGTRTTMGNIGLIG